MSSLICFQPPSSPVLHPFAQTDQEGYSMVSAALKICPVWVKFSKSKHVVTRDRMITYNLGQVKIFLKSSVYAIPEKGNSAVKWFKKSTVSKLYPMILVMIANINNDIIQVIFTFWHFSWNFPLYLFFVLFDRNIFLALTNTGFSVGSIKITNDSLFRLS